MAVASGVWILLGQLMEKQQLHSEWQWLLVQCYQSCINLTLLRRIF